MDSRKTMQKLTQIKFSLKHPELQGLDDLVRLSKRDKRVARLLKDNHVVNKANFQRKLRDKVNDCINSDHYIDIDRYIGMQKFIKSNIHTPYVYLRVGLVPCNPTRREVIVIVNSIINQLKDPV